MMMKTPVMMITKMMMSELNKNNKAYDDMKLLKKIIKNVEEECTKTSKSGSEIDNNIIWKVSLD